MSLRKSGVSYGTTQFPISPIFTFYQLNDIVLNRKKVSRYLGEYKRIVRDEAYTTEQIHTALQTADIRMRMIILILSSTGARIGSLPGLVLGNLRKLPNYGIYRTVFYQDTILNIIHSQPERLHKQGLTTIFFTDSAAGRNSPSMRRLRNGNPMIHLLFDYHLMLMICCK